MSLRSDATALHEELRAVRRDLHQAPEIGLYLPRTQEKVLAALDGLPLEITTGKEVSSVVGVLRGGKPGGVVLLRGDMDALPVTERTGARNSPAMSSSCSSRGKRATTAPAT